jgi:hypothetical protein
MEANMKRKTILLMGLILFFCLPSLGFADCAPLGRMDRWVVQENGSIIFYAGNVALGTVELQECTVNSTSVINLPAPSVCDGDEILVDGRRCTIASLKVPES